MTPKYNTSKSSQTLRRARLLQACEAYLSLIDCGFGSVELLAPVFAALEVEAARLHVQLVPQRYRNSKVYTYKLEDV